MISLYDQEEATKAYGREQKNEGVQEGERKNATATAERMIRKGTYADAEIADISGLTVKEVQKIKTTMLTAV